MGNRLYGNNYQMPQQDDDDQRKKLPNWAVNFALVWLVLGLVSYVWALMCFGKGGSLAEKAIGLLVAMFSGPLYLVYYYVMSGSKSKYCS